MPSVVALRLGLVRVEDSKGFIWLTSKVRSDASSTVSRVPASRIASASLALLSTEIVVGSRHSVEPGAETLPGSQARQKSMVPSVSEPPYVSAGQLKHMEPPSSPYSPAGHISQPE